LAASAAAEVAGFVSAARQAVADGETQLLDVFEEAARRVSGAIERAMVAGAAALVCGNTPSAAQCGEGHQVGVHSVRPKSVNTMAGHVEVRRAYHYCRQCGQGFFPADRLLGVEGRTTSAALDKAVTALAREVPFARSADLIEEITGRRPASTKTVDRIAKRAGRAARALIEADTAAAVAAGPAAHHRRWDNYTTACIFIDGTGLPMVPSETTGRHGKQPDGSSKTREVKIGRLATQTGRDKDGHPVLDENSTSYVATFDAVGGFTADIAAETLRRDFARAPRTCVIADGATWIWNLADRLWPGAVQIVDYYHATEHVHDLLDLLKPHLGGADPTPLATELKDRLYTGRIQALVDRVRQIPLPGHAEEAKVATAVAYFTKNWSRMQYASFARRGLFIGSGAAESSCKSLAENRAAMSGMRWTINGADPIIALRALHRADHDNRYDRIFDPTTPRTTKLTTPHQQT
jgi:transposase